MIRLNLVIKIPVILNIYIAIILKLIVPLMRLDQKFSLDIYIIPFPDLSSNKSNTMSDTEYIKLKVKLTQNVMYLLFLNSTFIPGCRPGLQRDPLSGEADHPDGQAEEKLQRAGSTNFTNAIKLTSNQIGHI